MKPRKSKIRQKKNTCGLVDRISELPDSILGLIVSLLPTNKAVATSILSKRWQFLWVTIHNLDFCCGRYSEVENMKFVQFANRVLLLHDNIFLNRFCLDWKPCCISSQVITWINTVITKNVHELSLCLGDEELYMPISVFNCDSLRSLKLDGCVTVSSAPMFCLPRLEILELVGVDFESEETFEKLINGCSMLDDLHIDKAIGGFTYRIFSTSLRRLYYMSDCNLKLEASSLEYLYLNGFMSEVLVPKNLSSLVEANLRIGYEFCLAESADSCNSIVEVVHASDRAKFLTLSDDVMQSLRHATVSLSTEFNRLVKLETEIECCPWSSLRDFIQNADNLDDLTIYQSPLDPDDEICHDHSKWTTPVEVPRCLSNSLKKVSIDGYRGLDDEHGMILYMLKHGSVLEVMHISCYRVSDGERFELLQKIRESPKNSPTCEVRL